MDELHTQAFGLLLDDRNVFYIETTDEEETFLM
jgi:hypothetical protein